MNRQTDPDNNKIDFARTDNKEKNRFRLGRRGGVTRAAAILLVLIGVMLVVIAIPVWKAYQFRAQRLACEQAMKSARDGLIIEYLSRFEEGSVEEAMRVLDEVMPERANLCPAGGTIYLVRRKDGIFEPICGLHDPDKKHCARLNASYALEQLQERRRLLLREVEDEPESIEIRVNGKELECFRVQEEEKLRRGTRTTNGYEGIVAFYGINGEGSFSTDEVKTGEICYFVYADEDYCAIWRAGEEWSGSAYDA